jgi:hypothetical protein
VVQETAIVIDLYRTAADVQSVCRENGWQFCFIGGVALQRWGKTRVTEDVDLTVLTGFQQEEHYLRTLLARFPGRIPDALDFALQNRVLLLQSRSGVGIDISLAGLPFEESVVARASDFEFEQGISLHTCSAEDLIVYKAFANRSRDWADIEGVLIRQANKLDWDYIGRQLKPLVELKEEPEIWENLMRHKAAAAAPQADAR